MKPEISIVIIGYDMGRELPRTVSSFTAPYQVGMAPGAVEIVLVDNGSTVPVQRNDFSLDANIKLIRLEKDGVSPCRAINEGIRNASADMIGVVIDGARMASPGAVRTALDAARLSSKAFVATLGFHLGPKVQQISVTEGYDRQVEDQLLNQIGWPDNGYGLFEICALGESYSKGVLAPPPETTFFVMDKAQYWHIGGYNEDFVSLGGGLASFDLFHRAIAAADDDFVMLVGEGTFHQLHYGATTQAGGIRRKAEGERTLGEVYAREYEAIVGRAWQPTQVMPTLFGRLTHPSARKFFFPSEA